MKLKTLLPTSLLAAGMLSVAALPAQSATCSAGSVTAFGLGPSTSCIGSFRGNDAQGNGTGALFNQLTTGVFDNITNWEFVGKSDAGQFNVSSNGTSGTWSVAPSAPLTGPFVLSLKAGNNWSAYFFKGMDEAFSVLGGNWETVGVSTNRRGVPQGLSHATIYRAVVPTTPPKDPVGVPEPTTVFALGVVAVGGLSRLKKRV